MCKPWPGLRCTDHPMKRVEKLHLQVFEKENILSRIDETMGELTKTTPEVELQDDAAWQALNGQRTKILADIGSLNEKKEQEICNFHTTAGGIKSLETKAADTNQPVVNRIEAASEFSAASERRGEQKSLGKVLTNPDVPNNSKTLWARQEMLSTKKSLTKLKVREVEIKNSLTNLQHNIDAAKEAGFKEEVKELSLKKARLLTELSFTQKHIQQKQIKRQELVRWIDRFCQKNINMIFNLTDKAIVQLFKLV